MVRSVFYFFTMYLFFLGSLFSHAQQCGLSEDKIKEISWSLFCGEFEDKKKQIKGSYSVQTPNNDLTTLLTYCESGPTAAGLARVGLGTAAFTLASEYFINSALVTRMLPFVTDAAIDAYMAATGMTPHSLEHGARRLGLPLSAMKVKIRDRIRIELARTYLFKLGYLSTIRAPVKLSKVALVGTEVAESAAAEAFTRSLLAELGGEGVEAAKPRVGDPTPKQTLKTGKKEAFKLVSDHMKSEIFYKEAMAAGESFGKMLGKLNLPLKAPIRVAAIVAPALFVASVLIGVLEPSALGCTDKIDVNRIISRDSNNKCKPIVGISPQVIYGLTNPSETKNILNTDRSACLAYTRIYQEKVLGVPANAEDRLVVKNNDSNDCQISWVNGNIQGYRRTKKDNKFVLYYRPASKMGTALAPWKEASITNLAQPREVLDREIEAACEGRDSGFVPQYLEPGRGVDNTPQSKVR